MEAVRYFGIDHRYQCDRNDKVRQIRRGKLFGFFNSFSDNLKEHWIKMEKRTSGPGISYETDMQSREPKSVLTAFAN